VANQIFAQFVSRYDDSRKGGSLPSPEPEATLPTWIPALLKGLNDGPDLTESADPKRQKKLPAQWRLSTSRISPSPAPADDGLAQLSVRAFEDFEHACARLASACPEVAALSLQGVSLDPRLASIYSMNTAPFSARRLDTIVDDIGHRWVIESDEMPGGLAVAYHLDTTYGVNGNRWEHLWKDLTKDGPLVFLVSTDWGRQYVTEFAWLVEHLKRKSYPVHLVTTDQAESLSTDVNGLVRLGSTRIGTIWRQFPIFEAKGRLSEIVEAAYRGGVRLLPEFASWGNKIWFGLFWRYKEHFVEHLPTDSYRLIEESFPNSKLISTENDYPLRFSTTRGEIDIASPQELLGLTRAQRQSLVIKVAGANRHSSRSRGVLVGLNSSNSAWQTGVARFLSMNAEFGIPLILQEMHRAATVSLPVFNARDMTAEVFSARVLERPWTVAGVLTSSILHCIPATTHRLHGSVDMCELPRRLSSEAR
jgi:hypothetical protein